MSTVNTISLDEIILGGSVRFTSDGMLFAADVVKAITGKDNNDAGLVLRR
jgi:hypothetical protein